VALNGTERQPFSRRATGTLTSPSAWLLATALMLVGMTHCLDCSGARSVPDVFGDPGPCPSCVVESDDGVLRDGSFNRLGVAELA
jgi:hypothetical protein